MGLATADSTDVGIDHLLLRDSETLDEMHEIVEGFLNIDSATLKKESFTVYFELYKS